MAEAQQGVASIAQSATGLVANRRDILRTATGLAAAALVGGAMADQHRVVMAAGPDSAITGEIADLGQFEVLAFSWGASNSGSAHVGGGAGAGKVNVQDVSLTKYTDALTPDLFLALALGKHYQRASLTYGDKKGNPISRLLMEEVLLTSLQLERYAM